MKNIIQLSKKISITTSLLLLINSNAFSAGFEAPLHSTSALGSSYSGAVTGVHDISNSFENPANTSGIKNKELLISASYLDINIDSDNASGVNNNPDYNSGVNKLIPALYYAMPVNEKLAFGLNITTPYGLATEYSDNWAINNEAIKSEIIANNFNPYLSYKLNNKLSVGAGFQAQYIETTLTKKISGVHLATLETDDWGYGFNLGAKYKINNATNAAFGYRSKIDHKTKGTGKAPTANISDDILIPITTPESLIIGISHKINNDLQITSDIRWMRWSRIEKFDIISNTANLDNDDLTLKLKDSFRYSVGLNLRNNSKILSRFGIAYEEGANSSAEYRSPRIPTGDRTWLSYGLNYKLNQNINLDFSYLHQIHTKTSTNNNSKNIAADYKTNVNVFSAAINYKF